MNEILTVNEPAQLRHEVNAWQRAGQRVAFVPTMGALHEGHASLIRLARTLADRVVASVFVNPTQFGPNEDFLRYPRTLEADRALLAREGADLLYTPAADTMYGEGFATEVRVKGITERFCGASRPGHFDGVALVVAKLFNRVRPDVAVFGEKDWQQLQVIRRMVADLDFPIEIVGAPTLREADGLALSSRNRYLSEAERARAPMLAKVMREVAGGLAASDGVAKLNAAGFRVDYLEVADAETLQPWQPGRPGRVLAAAWLGATRLIDNVALAA